ncbi:ImmA/IrrE family metallo-endopeptidase [Paenibacillus sp. FSL E2-0177]|uniref:ImmA/IrrE family metallo-endopeptidase n=1 Tax=Paenibacillus sp. FSL E2-0177 TaxID=2921360 RepID=UPI0030EF8B99
MRFCNYFKTPLEQSIQDVYLENGILVPEDLAIDRIARIFQIDVVFEQIITFSDNQLMIIFLQSGIEQTEQRKSFYHELGHVLRHAGDQRFMSKLFRQLQEADAERFCLYAAIPLFMLERIQLPAEEETAAGHIAKLFRVPPEFALQRLRQIQRRIADTEFLTAFTYTATAREEKAPPLPMNTEPVIRGIYGLDDLSSPHTLVIEQRGGFDWEKPLYIGMNSGIKSVDSRSYTFRDGAIVKSSDLSVSSERTGCVMIDMGRIASRHGYAVDRLFLPMEAVDDAINF